VIGRWIGGLLVCASAGAAVAGAQDQGRTRPPDTSAKAVIARAAAYVKDYQTAWKYLLADEVNIQRVADAAGQPLAGRRTEGDFFLSYVQAEGRWLSVRDVATVDGEPVDDRGDLRELLRIGAYARIGRMVADHNARYNVGSIERNFNDPMLAMVILSDLHRGRFRFTRAGVATTDTGVTLVTITFTERDRPTLVRGADGSQVPASGEFVIEAETGRLRRSRITMKARSITASLSTSFARNETLDLWLPSTLTERYEGTIKGRREVVTVESAYTNYRKFDVNVVIK